MARQPRRSTAKAKTLLVVDWDTFFRNPLEAGDRIEGDTDSLLLYDWGHREIPLLIEMLWADRAASFVANDHALPQMEPGWREFATRFTYAPGCTLTYADSNAYAGNVEGRFTDVWLYDAHHDCYRLGTSVTDWAVTHMQKGMLHFSCEDWMAVHALQGARLHHRWPAFREDPQTRLGVDYGALPKGFALDGQRDDPANDPTVAIDHVFVCRSGAWVPPWCDADFETFVRSFGLAATQVDDQNFPRPFSMEEVARRFAFWQRASAQFAAEKAAVNA